MQHQSWEEKEQFPRRTLLTSLCSARPRSASCSAILMQDLKAPFKKAGGDFNTRARLVKTSIKLTESRLVNAARVAGLAKISSKPTSRMTIIF